MPTVPGQIFETLGELGKTVATETGKVPAEIAGKALESLGAAKSGQGTQTVKTPAATEASRIPDEWDSIDKVEDAKVKQAVARAALSALIRRAKQSEPSVWERTQKEAEEEKAKKIALAAKAAQEVLPQTSQKRPRGDLYGIKAKRGAAEMSRNIRQD